MSRMCTSFPADYLHFPGPTHRGVVGIRYLDFSRVLRILRSTHICATVKARAPTNADRIGVVKSNWPV